MSINFDQVLSSKWMSKDDVPTQGVDLIIRSITQEQVGDELEEKLALHFHGSYKPLLLNRTNIRILQSIYGSDSSKCLNQPICVYCDPTISYGGRLTGGVRLRMPQPAQRPAAPPAPSKHPQFTAGQPIRTVADIVDAVPF
jgi:hypothetical protein